MASELLSQVYHSFFLVETEKHRHGKGGTAYISPALVPVQKINTAQAV